jgi:hypothetical protein
MRDTLMIPVFMRAKALRTISPALNPEELYPLRRRIGKRAACTHTLIRNGPAPMVSNGANGTSSDFGARRAQFGILYQFASRSGCGKWQFTMGRKPFTRA